MSPEVRECVEKVAEIGWTFDCYDGQGHVVLRHVTGQRYSIPATPSDHRSLKNSLAVLERLAGQKLPRVQHRRSRKAVRPSGFSLYSKPRPEAIAAAARVDALLDHHEEQRREWAALIAHPTRDNARRARDLLSEIRAVETELTSLHQPVEKIA